jgi:Na+-translocating ferredoxin:NAD+ oxidoreductase RnfG subunit
MRIFAIILISSFVTNFDVQTECTLSRKILKGVHRIYDVPLEFQRLDPAEYQNLLTGDLREYDCLYLMKNAGETTGYLIVTRAKGRFDYFDYIVIFSPEKEVKGVSVIEYRSDHGAGICQKGWLKQFEGYQGGNLQVGKNIDGVSGGTISANSIVSDIQRCHHLIGLITAY